MAAIQIDNLETWLDSRPDKDFPDINPENTKPFRERYDILKTKLGPLHDQVEIGAMSASFKKALEELTQKMNSLSGIDKCKEIDMLHYWDPLIYLNQHGKGHVVKVIKQATDLVNMFTDLKRRPSAFEIFLLLCAIQIHDIGNIKGRFEHESSFRQEVFQIAKESFITDPVTIRTIFKIAMVHGGRISGSRDTITEGRLLETAEICNETVRPQLLAAILRFADELADDNSRYFTNPNMPASSKLFHDYSKSLHTVKIMKNPTNPTYYLQLCYFLTFNDASQKYIKDGKEILLIDEIFERTIKMELERRYCLRFLAQNIQLTEIKVTLDLEKDWSEQISREYTLKEEGYPSGEIKIAYRDEIRQTIVGGKNNDG